MQGFDNIFGLVEPYFPYKTVLLSLLGLAILFFIVKFLYIKFTKKEHKLPISDILQEQYRTLEGLKDTKKDFAVFATTFIKRLFSHILGVDLLSLTTSELENYLTDFDLNKIYEELEDNNFYYKDLLDMEHLLKILRYLDDLKFKNLDAGESLDFVLAYAKELLNFVIKRLNQQKEVKQ